MNASTFAARVTISTESDLTAAVTSALGTMKGPLHGGAPSGVISLLNEFKNPTMIRDIVREIEVDGIYEGTVVRIMPFGAFIDLGSGKEGLLHISKISKKRVEKVEDELSIGDKVTVKVYEIDDQGRINLTKKDLEVESTEE